MKRFIRSNYSLPKGTDIMSFDIVIDIIPKYTTEEVKAAMYKGFEIPDGEVISGIKGAIITDQILSDYNAFIESVEDLLMEYYGLKVFYTNQSDGHSQYYSFFAKDKNTGKIYFKFKLRLRISNHDPHRSKESQAHKKEDTKTDDYKKLMKGIKKDPRPYTQSIVANKEKYDSYETAFIEIDKNIEHWIDVMTK